MHRMRRYLFWAGITVTAACFWTISAKAELIQPPGGRAYPDLAGAITGEQSYVYNPETQTGNFRASNTPYLLSVGPTVGDEAVVQPDSTGTRSQVLNVTLDQNGRLVNDSSNVYALYGSVNIAGREYRGLLLTGTPTSFGSKAGNDAAFNLDLKVTGGALAGTFGPELYMELHPKVDASFDGSFNKSFRTRISSSNTLGYNAPKAATVPEPTTLVVLLTCGAGLLIQKLRRRLHAIRDGAGHEDMN